VGSDSSAYVAGNTSSTNFPTANPLQPTFAGGPLYGDAFAAKLDPGGSRLMYSTYVGGSGDDYGTHIAVDTAGNAYITGATSSTNFPTADPLQPTLGGRQDAFVMKLSASGTALVYSTYLGGSDSDVGNGIAVDAAGSAYVTGWTFSTDFPTADPLQPASGGDIDVFVAKLNAEGSALVYSTYLGGYCLDGGQGIAVDAAGNAYVTGRTCSSDFPTANPLQPAYGGGFADAFVAKVDAAGSALVYSTYLGGRDLDQGLGIAVDAGGHAQVTRWVWSNDFPTVHALQPAHGGGLSDAFVAQVDAEGSALVYSTYLGGNGLDGGWGIAADAAGNAYVTGATYSTNFPTQNPLQDTCGNCPSFTDAFLTKLAADGSTLLYSTYLGGSHHDGGQGLAVDAEGNAYVTGQTASTDFPTVNPLQPANGGGSDAFVAKVDGEGLALLYSTYLGGGAFDGGAGVAVDAEGSAYVTGTTSSGNLQLESRWYGTPFGDFHRFVTALKLPPLAWRSSSNCWKSASVK
jgi:hypothetical protein